MSITPGLTPLQSKVWTVARAMTEANGFGPTYEELRQNCGLTSKSEVHRAIVALEERGYIRRRPGSSRSIITVDPEQTETSAFANHVRQQIAHLRVQLKRTDDVDKLIKITDQIDNLLYRLEKWGTN